MRGLNLLRACRSPDCWKRHQLSCIEDAVSAMDGKIANDSVSSIDPLIPGSRLYNQLLKIDHRAAPLALKCQPSVSSLDPVYESLSYPMQWPQGSTILVDINDPDQWCIDTLRETIDKLLNNNVSETGLDTLLVLQPGQLTGLKNMFASYPIRVQSLHPEWCNAAQMLAFYRGASHTVFINTARAADAAFCDIPNTLICGEVFIESQKTNALWKVIAGTSASQLVCAVPTDQDHELPRTSLIDNRLGDLRSALTQSIVRQDDDWLTEYMVAAELNKPVIHGEDGFRKTVQAITDTRISLRRKGQKLQEDPKQFCVDSKNPVLRAIGRLLPSRVAA